MNRRRAYCNRMPRHNVVEGFELGPSPGAEQLGYEQPEPVAILTAPIFQQLEAPSQDGDFEDADKSYAKRKRSEDDDTLHNFSDDITNMRASSAPLIERPPEKHRKIRGHIELFEGELLAKVMQEFTGNDLACGNFGLQFRDTEIGFALVVKLGTKPSYDRSTVLQDILRVSLRIPTACITGFKMVLRELFWVSFFGI
ncbi:hypothetical protein BD769DRAFT_1384109 [Suillus cothurnatus]|nr:hypothetical protein BD769DRAFT_1384109 [Suillus cothurnatus]